MSDFAVKVTIRNGRIVRRMREVGIGSVAELARKAGAGYATVIEIVGLKKAPLKADGSWRAGVEDIAGVLRCDPEDLFSDTQRQMALEANSAETFMDETSVAQLASGDTENDTWTRIEVQRLLAGLPNERERDVVMRRAAGETLEEIGADWNVGKERIAQLERQAIRRMKVAISRSNKNVARRMIIDV